MLETIIDQDIKQSQSKEEYSNKYQQAWESRSTIRTRPRKIIDFNEAGYFFPEERQPLLLNKVIASFGEEVKEKILLHSFYKYLNDIVNLEIRLINSACCKIMFGDLIVKYDDIVKLNANTIVIDEFYHVYVAKDMMWQLHQHFKDLEVMYYPISDSYSAFIKIKEKLDKKCADVFEILAVCIFETTLVRELVEFFNTENIHPSIKYYVNDHMNDESKHAGFFFDLLKHTWANIPTEYQDNIGEHLAEFIKLYLNINSDKIFGQDLLKRILKDESQSIQIIEELYEGFDINPEIPIVKNVLAVLRKAGVMENKYAKESFQKAGWNLG